MQCYVRVRILGPPGPDTGGCSVMFECGSGPGHADGCTNCVRLHASFNSVVEMVEFKLSEHSFWDENSIRTNLACAFFSG